LLKVALMKLSNIMMNKHVNNKIYYGFDET